jgi:hypothetical protein
MAFPAESDRPAADPSPSPDAPKSESPPLAPSGPEQSPWWSAPGGKPFSIPDFAHEFAAMLASLVAAPQPIPIRVKARRLS